MFSFTPKKGYTLIEAVVYVTILTIVITAILGVTLALTRTYKNALSAKNIENSIISFSGRVQREVRDATTINIAASTLNSNNGILTLDNVSDLGVTKTYRFYLSGQRVFLDIDGVNQGALTLSGARVTALRFERLANSNTEAVRWSMTVESGLGTTRREELITSSSVLRGSY